MTDDNHFSDLSIDKVKRLAKEAGLDAREESLNSGIEIMSQDEDGNFVYEKKDENGNIIRRIVKKDTGKDVTGGA